MSQPQQNEEMHKTNYKSKRHKWLYQHGNRNESDVLKDENGEFVAWSDKKIGPYERPNEKAKTKSNAYSMWKNGKNYPISESDSKKKNRPKQSEIISLLFDISNLKKFNEINSLCNSLLP